MNLAQRNEFFQERMTEILSLAASKGAVYSKQTNALSNFYDQAKRSNLSPFQVWLIFFEKHVAAIENAIINDPFYPIELTESMNGRINDAIAYLLILSALLEAPKCP